MIKIEDFKKEHSTNMKRLNEYLNDDLMGPIAEWIMEEKGNPLVWMDPNYYNQMRTLGGVSKAYDRPENPYYPSSKGYQGD